MLGPVELERLQAEVEALRRSLFEKATDAYASLHDTTTAVTQLRELKELDEHKAFLSPSYLQTLRASESIRTVEGRAREVTASYDNSDLVRLLKGTNELTEQLAKQETAGATDRETYENLRAVFIAGIKQALIRYYQQQVTEANAASDIERRKLAVGLAADRAREITAAVIELERKPTQAMAKFKDSSYGFLLTDPVLKFNASHERELVFSPTFETLPLTVLVALAKKIQKETGQHAAFSELHNTPVSSTKKFYDYFRCEYWMRKLTYRITPTEEGTAFLAKVDPFERGLVERTNEVRRLQASTASGIGAATTHLQRVVSPAIAACNQQISTTKAALLRIASDEAKESALQHATIQRAQRIVAERKAAFVEQSNRLATLIAEYEVLQADAKIIPEAENQRLVVKMAAVDVKFKQILEQQPHVNAAKKLVAKGVRALNELLGQVQEKYRGDAYQTALRAQAEVTAQVLAIDEENKLANDKVPGFILQRRALDVRLAESNRLAELQRLAEEREREREEKAQQALAGLEATYQRALTAFNLMNTTNESLKQIEIKVNEQSATDGASLETLRIRSAGVSSQIDPARALSDIVTRESALVGRLLDEVSAAMPSLPAGVKESNAYQAYTTKYRDLRNRNLAYLVEPQDNNALIEGIVAKQKVLGTKIADAEEKQVQLVLDVLAFFKKVFDDKNVKDFWYYQVSFPGRIKACMDGARVNVKNDDGTFTLTSVPRGLFNGRKFLDKVDKLGARIPVLGVEGQVQMSEQEILLEFAKALSLRLGVDSYGREKPTDIVYKAVKDELLTEGGTLKPLTDATLVNLKAKIQGDIFRGLVLDATQPVRAQAAAPAA